MPTIELINGDIKMIVPDIPAIGFMRNNSASGCQLVAYLHNAGNRNQQKTAQNRKQHRLWLNGAQFETCTGEQPTRMTASDEHERGTTAARPRGRNDLIWLLAIA